ncbi:ribose-phosphate diphosphokinase [Nocardia cyriacigeorgica]|uniref:ribose-phosphate diphosphokinase n=1 Tax=Nocardia cyriacigeorgica TaxID=135487 RepID=A0A6P1D131_9NOCA|nr:ribose-phosphate pyrophosphokinase [Nocardia cyriacigeorgica]NEW43284.1 ribose-phosphate pyrophosphokinase [Nocardia cyriacigeorgica]
MTEVRIVGGSTGAALAPAVAELLDVRITDYTMGRYPDGELQPRVEHLGGQDVYIVQSTSPPVGEHLMELLLLIDACRRAGAARVTAVVPYFGYARQDQRELAGQALGARVAADAIANAGADRLVVVDPHTPALEAVCSIPVETLSAVPLLAHHIAPAWTEAVVVAPDLGAAELAERYAKAMRESVAVVRKFRVNETNVVAREILGDVIGHRAVIVDDMICSGATIEATMGLIRHNAADIAVAATHGPLTTEAVERLSRLGLRRIVVTDSVVLPNAASTYEVCTLAPLLAEAIDRLHRDYPEPKHASLVDY